MALHRLPAPEACVLWNAPERLAALKFETVVAFDEDDGFVRSLVRCPECGQLYFCDQRPTRGEDFRTLIPVPTAEHAAALALAAHASLLRIRPILREDWPADQETATALWWRNL